MVLPLIAGGLLAARFLIPKIAARLIPAIAKFAVKRPITTFITAPTVIGLLTVPEVRKPVLKFLSPKERVKAGKEFGEKLTGVKPADGGDLIKTGLKAAGILGALVGAIAAAKLIKEKLPKKEKVISAPEQLVPPGVLPSMEPIGPVVKAPEEKIVQPVPSIINKINVTPIVNVRINQSRKFINQQLLIRA